MEDKKQIKNRLNKELENIRFTKQTDVLKKVYRPTWKDKLHQLWNKEISIPILPVSSAVVILLFGYGFFTISEFNNQDEYSYETIEIGGNTYWKAEVERRLVNEE
ncbi:hypothetical protein [Oceanobacillus sp. AG]|uniref:hypothetical protein n=1 Tax=Oceanobacillus sp. AG TaxID=2681969 RepID=UPI0012EC1881|nr:hypothetical protein [Oceanobacillus sp. AG]